MGVGGEKKKTHTTVTSGLTTIHCHTFPSGMMTFAIQTQVWFTLHVK